MARVAGAEAAIELAGTAEEHIAATKVQAIQRDRVTREQLAAKKAASAPKLADVDAKLAAEEGSRASSGGGSRRAGGGSRRSASRWGETASRRSRRDDASSIVVIEVKVVLRSSRPSLARSLRSLTITAIRRVY